VIRVDAEDAWQALRKAAWFSLLSAVSIGFDQFDPSFGFVAYRLASTLSKAVGWVAGAQALLRV